MHGDELEKIIQPETSVKADLYGKNPNGVKSSHNQANKNKVNLHAGHRERMKERYLKCGADGFTEHELLEMLLYYSLPRKNTNEIAHELIHNFGDLKDVLEATPDELMQISGIKESSAILISLVCEINRRASISANKDCLIFDRLSVVGKYLTDYYRGLSKERFCVMYLDNSMRLIDFVKLSEGSVNSTAVDYRTIASGALFKGASSVIISHNHPNGLALPSVEDREVSRAVESALSVVGVTLLEHIIVGSENYFPTMKSTFGFLRAVPILGKFDDDFVNRFYDT